MRHISLRLWALVALSAFLQWLAFPIAGPVPTWRRLVCWICLVPLLVALSAEDREGKPLPKRVAALLGYSCGTLWFFGNCYWVYQTMFHYGGLPEAAAAGILILFSLYLGLYLGLFGFLFAQLRRLLGKKAALVLAPMLWVAVELARARITGFPWDLLGYTQVDNFWLTPVAPVAGVMGLSLIVAAGNAVWLWRGPGRLRFVGPLIGLLLVIVQVGGTLQHVAPSRVSATATLLQENLSVGAEAGTSRETQAAMLEDFTRLTLAPRRSPALADFDPTQSLSKLDLLAWPEAPTNFEDADPNLRAALGALAKEQHAPLVVDAVGVSSKADLSERPNEFVSASFYLPDGSYAGRYDKMHLVPFGEYTPYKQLFFFAGHLLDGLNFVPGTQRRLFGVEGRRYGVFICYESIFGDEIREFAESGAQVLVNLSDDGWYGDTSAPWEHLDMARMRAIENRRWLLRDTNTGLTASIDPEGRIVAGLPRHIRDAILVPFAYRNDLTFYTRHGDWIAWLCTLVVVACLVGGWLQRRQAPAVAKTVD